MATAWLAAEPMFCYIPFVPAVLHFAFIEVGADGLAV